MWVVLVLVPGKTMGRWAKVWNGWDYFRYARMDIPRSKARHHYHLSR
jgi:hypothetical protein